MNKEIEYVTNVTTSASLDATGQWTLGQLPFADEVVIRQITYSSSNAIKPIFSIWSNLGNNGILASVCACPGFTSNPGTRIQLRNPPQAQTTFQMMLGTAIATSSSGDFVAINMDFIKYRTK